MRLPIGDQVRQPMHPADVGETYHRQVLAIGEEGQAKVQGTQVAIVGLGGVGSVVAQQLAHLGVSQFVLVDDDRVERTNLHRLVGSIPSDVGAHKVDVANRQIKAINRRVQVTRLPSSVRTQEALDAIKGVDVLFGCVDTDGARLVLNELALAYLVPYIDCGVGIIAGTEGLEEAGGEGQRVDAWAAMPALYEGHQPTRRRRGAGKPGGTGVPAAARLCGWRPGAGAGGDLPEQHHRLRGGNGVPGAGR